MNKPSEAVPQISHQSAGSILRAARKAKGISIELAAHDLKMRSQQVLDLEEDDYARLPKATYIRLLILYYAKYLNVNLARLEPYLPEKWDVQNRNFEYSPLEPKPSLESKGVVYDPEETQRFSLPNQVLPSIFTCCVALAVLSLATYFYFYWHHNREDENFLSSPASDIMQTEVQVNNPPALSLKTIRTFDSALLEKASNITTTMRPLLKLTTALELKEKAELVQSAMTMKALPAFPNVTPQTTITAPRNKK